MLSRSFIARRAFVSAPVRSFQTAPVLRVGKESALRKSWVLAALVNVDCLDEGIGKAHRDMYHSRNIKLTIALDEEGRADEAERIKNEQIQKQKQGKGEWHEGIASDSESIVSHLHFRSFIPTTTNTVHHRSRQTEVTSRPTPTR